MRPERKIKFRQKKIGPHFLSLNCVQTTIWAPLCYRKSLEQIRRMRNVSIYSFRHVHLEPLKNAIFSPVKTFDELF